MEKLIVIACIILLSSCSESNEDIDTSIPTCIDEILEDSNLPEDIVSIRVQENDDELHYWISTGVMEVDGVEFIVDSQCDTVCSLGGFVQSPDCAGDYGRDSWVIIWEE